MEDELEKKLRQSADDQESETSEAEESEDEEESLHKEPVKEPNGNYDQLNGATLAQKDEIIRKLQDSNTKLRQKLEEVVDRATTKLQKESVQYQKIKSQIEEYKTQYKIKSKELNNVHKKLEIAQKEIRTLTYKVETTSNEEILNNLMSKNKELKKKNEDLKKEIRACEKIQNEQSKELMKVSEEKDFYYKIRCLTEELRMQKSRFKEVNDKFHKERKLTDKLKDKIRDLEIKVKQTRNDADPNNSAPNGRDIMITAKMEDLEITNNRLQRKLDTAAKKLKTNKIMLGKEAKDCREELEKLELMFRDKDKECRLLTIRLKEMQRMGKFPKLKPLDLDTLKDYNTEGRAKSTMRNQENDLFNPRINYTKNTPQNRRKLSTTRSISKGKFTVRKNMGPSANHISLGPDSEPHNKSVLIPNKKISKIAKVHDMSRNDQDSPEKIKTVPKSVKANYKKEIPKDKIITSQEKLQNTVDVQKVVRKLNKGASKEHNINPISSLQSDNFTIHQKPTAVTAQKYKTPEPEEEEEEEESEEEESEEESVAIPTKKVVEEEKTVSASIQNDQMAKEEKMEDIESYKSTSSNRKALSQATEGYIEDVIQKVSGTGKREKKVKEKNVQQDVIKSIQSLVSQRKSSQAVTKLPTRVTEKLKEDSDSEGSNIEDSSFKDYKI
ncbi:unnamed protein product [Moneuplotes crassus]|uniref:Uncharacterized protein n=1 Tax=Euplotes crassus TaxID=5936 RepID=A0AAD2D4V0_EUPCR|nr:unnamed protein product [Moneuplotes crassus]